MSDPALSPSRGERVVRLLADPGWIHRRVETVQLSLDGETRRGVSFDFTLPMELELCALRKSKESSYVQDSERVILPLCFMHKGTLVDLDALDCGGAALPVLSLGENGALIKEGILWLLEIASYTANSEKLANDVIYSTHDGGEVPDRATAEELNRSRKEFLTDLASYVLDGGNPPQLPQEDPHVSSFLSWVLSITKSTGSDLLCIDAQNTPVTGISIRTAVALAAALLAAMAEDYVFAVEFDRKMASHRSLVKISYASMVSRVAKGPFNWPSFLGRQNLRLTLATSAANSTHVELVTTGSVVVAAISNLSADGSLPFRSFAFSDRRHHLSTSRRERIAGPTTELLVSLAPSRVGVVTAALVASIVNMLGQVALFTQVGPTLKNARRLASFATNPPLPSEVAEILGPLRDSNAYAVALASLSVAIALAVVVQLHDVERRLLRIPRILLLMAAGLFSVALLMASYEAQSGGGLIFHWMLTRWIFLFCSIAVMVYTGIIFFSCKSAKTVTNKAKTVTNNGRLAHGGKSTDRSSALVATESALFERLNIGHLAKFASTFEVWKY